MDTVKEQIDALVGALTDPIVVYDPGWGVPDRLKGEIQLQRLAQLMKGEEGLASEAEALAYLSNASLAAPMHPDWVDLYLYLFTRVKGDKVPPDLRKESLDPWRQEKLRHLKEWLWRTRVEYRRKRGRQEKAQREAEVAAAAPKQLGLPL